MTDGLDDDGQSGDDETAGADDSDSADDGSGEPGDGYPDEVLDYLDLPWPPHEYDEELPAHFQTAEVQAMDNTPADNPISDAGATLGRVLFYDTMLSANGTVSCASCHQQSDGFTDPLTLSEGFEGGLTGRNSMSLANARFYDAGHFFWDERADTLEDQVLMPIQDPVEMGLTLEQLLERVGEQPYYPYLFEDAFGDPDVSTERISFALAQFVRSISSYRSPWDDGMDAHGDANVDFSNYSAEENLGKQLFLGQAGCAVCHLDQGGPAGPPGPGGGDLNNSAIFMLVAAANNGLDAALDNDDNGVGDVVGNANQNGLFKSPSLRNVELTGPYMHDGRFDTLRQVIDHYDANVQPHPNLDPRLGGGPGGAPRQLNLSNADKDALEAFLETLTDGPLLVDPRFADPFRN
ncbi:MAG: cytochrome c peroxidase [Myxococcota bacterium]